jgi:2-phospho-L-lactate guanylyltransferase
MNALIPLKRLDLAKSRLQEVLNPGERFELMRLLLENTLTEVLRTPQIAKVILVSSEPESVAIAAEWGISHFDDRRLPWNDALAAAMDEVVDSSEVLILSADLPLVTAADISRFVELAPVPGLAIARAVDAGTNGLVMSPAGAAETCFGVKGSAAQHRSLAEAAGLPSVVADIPGLALDLDSKDDVLAALAGDLPADLRTLLGAVGAR